MKNVNNSFIGKNILNYKSEEFSYHQIITSFYKSEQAINKIINKKKIRKFYFFSKSFTHNSISFPSGNNDFNNDAIIYIKDTNSNSFKSSNNEIQDIFKFNRKYDIKNISLLFPYINTDPRLNSVNITSSSLFLGSMLISKGFNIKFSKTDLNNTESCRNHFNSDLIGFTLFEDSFVEFKSFINNIDLDNDSIRAAGGPLITLNPIQSIYHLPEINLFVRGESEFCLPEIIDLINEGNPLKLLSMSGIFFQIPGMIIMSDFDTVNYPVNFSSLNFNLDFYKESQLSNGLEINFSRGCSKSCIFCSRVQGKEFRKLDILKIKELLVEFRQKLNLYSKDISKFRTININDDDILQDKEYAVSVFDTLSENGFSIWGIQSSISSFLNRDHSVNSEIISIIGNNIKFTKEKLVWIGTDTFLKKRGKRLGKIVPGERELFQLLSRFEKEKIFNYHYWISSDVLSGWDEFADELILIVELSRKYNFFGLLPHAPFIIPYPSTASFRFVSASKSLKKNIVYKKRYIADTPIFNMDIVDRVETDHHFLNELLKNIKPDGREGFFDYLKNGKFLDALINSYIFIKQERLYSKFASDQKKNIIEKTENKLYEIISKFI